MRTDVIQPTAAGTSLCRVDDVDSGGVRGFLPTRGAPRRVIVARRGECFFGWLDNCPHYWGGTPMAWRLDAYLDSSGEYLACHAHGALFEIETGECVMGPCLGQSLTSVPLEIGIDGIVRLAAELDWVGIQR